MPVVNETLDLPGSGSPTATVTVELVGVGAHPCEGFTSTSTVVGKLTPTVTAGAWSATLVGNDDITPAGTVYKRTVSGSGFGFSDLFEVPAAGGPYTVEELLTTAPASIEPSTYAVLADRVTVLEADPVTAAEVDDAITANGSSGRELAFDGDTSVFGPLATSSQTPMLEITFTVGARPVLVEFDLPAVYHPTVACAVIPQILHNGTLLASACISAPAGGILTASSGTVRKVFRTPGTYTVDGEVYASAGNPTVGYSNETEMTLRAVEQ